MHIDHQIGNSSDHIRPKHLDMHTGETKARQVQISPSDKVQILRHLHLFVC
jgi:hypothetical protein